MESRKHQTLIWKMCVALLAITFLFGVPASHAAPLPCSNGHSVSVDHFHQGDHHSKSKAAHGDQACCKSICAVCLLTFPSSTAVSTNIAIVLTRMSDLPDQLTGRTPSPGLRPPQAAA